MGASYTARTGGITGNGSSFELPILPAEEMPPRILGRGMQQPRDGGKPYVKVESRSGGAPHKVCYWYRNDELVTVCDCLGYTYRHECRHVDAARAELDPPIRYGLTEKGRAYLAQWRASRETSDTCEKPSRRAPSATRASTIPHTAIPGAEAMLRREPFSFWRQ